MRTSKGSEPVFMSILPWYKQQNSGWVQICVPLFGQKTAQEPLKVWCTEILRALQRRAKHLPPNNQTVLSLGE